MSTGTGPRGAFRLPIRVYYEDTDAAGVVYYANYLKFMERARTEWLAALGFDVATLARVQGIVFVVRRATIDYLRPAALGDRLHATMAVTGLGRASMTAAQDVERDAQVLAHADVTLACLGSATWRPARIPAALHSRLEESV